MSDATSDPFLEEGPIERIKREVLNDVERAYSKLWGPPVRVEGKSLRYDCKFHGGTHGTLSVTRGGARGVGCFKCWKCGERGDFIDAAGGPDAALQVLGLGRGPARRGAGAGGRGGEPVRRTEWLLHDDTGAEVARHVRLDRADGSKSFVWERDGRSGLGGLSVHDLPLYGADRLAATPEEHGPVVVTEGEKAADALGALGALAAGTVTGAATIPGAEALAVLRGRDVILWPDHDEVGHQHMRRIAAALWQAGTTCRLVDPEGLGLGEGEDAADYCARGGTLEFVFSHTQGYAPELHGLVQTLEFVAERFPETTWLWENWLPRGHVALLAGCPGAGKSGIALALAKLYLDGADWPDGQPTPDDDPTQRRVLWLETEDGHGILRDRCLAWGLPMARILLWGTDGLGRADLDKAETEDVLRDLVADNRCGLLVVDTLAGSHYQDENSAAIKRTMQVLTSVAARANVAVLVVHHLRKRQQNEAEGVTLDRVRGSSAIAALARVVLAAWRRDGGGDGVFMSVIKANLGRASGLVISTLSEDGEVSWAFSPEGAAPEVPLAKRRDERLKGLLAALEPGKWYKTAEIPALCPTVPHGGPLYSLLGVAVAERKLERRKEGRGYAYCLASDPA